ncbi:MAG: hypothetical protein ACKV2V_04530 [Blastocatellia bacterium]
MSKLTRRQYLKTAPAGLAAMTALNASGAPVTSSVEKPRAAITPGGLCLNEDNSHYFFTRAGKKLEAETVASFVDQYAGTQVRELILSVNSMRTSYASKVWDPIWRGYDPNGPDDQPLLASVPAAARAGLRGWFHTAWQLHQAGIDPYQLWLARARQKGVSGWLSMRMNDVHNVDDERHPLHSEFWRQNPQYRRVPYRFTTSVDRAFDYGHAEVRDYHFKLVRELIERYDFDGLELDWMRFGFHFRPGQEHRGLTLLTEFMTETRRLLDAAEKKRGHKIRLGARVPSRPQTALGLGYDPVTWARKKLIDMLVVTPFWASIETDMPIETWKELLRGTNVTLAAGLEVLIRTHPESKQFQMNTLETVRGAAASLLDRGADRIYLFNYMDSQTAMDGLENYPALLREAGQLQTMSGKSRRHIMTFADTWAPGEPRAIPLPASAGAGRWHASRLATGPLADTDHLAVLLGIDGLSEADVRASEIRVNGDLVTLGGAADLKKPRPESPVWRFALTREMLNRGYNLIEFKPARACQVTWVEIAMEA